MERIKQKSATGNTMVEYGLIGALVAMGCTMALMSMGQGVTQQFGGMLGSYKPDNTVKVTANLAASPAAALQSNGNLTANPSAGSTSVRSLTLSNGETLTVSVVPDIKSALQTSGANGTTVQLADSLSTVAHQLLQAGEITPRQEASLMALANEGHRVAKLEGVIQQAYQQYGPDFNALNNTYFTVDGETYSGTDSITSKTQLRDGAQLTPLLQAATQSGALDNPQVKQVVESLTKNMTSIAHDFGIQADAIFNGGDVTAGAAFVLQGTASTTTHQSSATVCTTGGNTDSGTSCSQ